MKTLGWEYPEEGRHSNLSTLKNARRTEKYTDRL